MPELRSDRLTDTWVLIAEQRSARPFDFRLRPPEPKSQGPCPFCPGNEGLTPPETFALRDRGAPNEPGWRVRGFPNKFPALEPRGAPVPLGHLLRRMAGVGLHEVLVDGPEHARRPRDRTPREWGDLALALQERLRALAWDPRVAYVLAFKNEGSGAAASLAHPHSQVVALPLVPERVRREVEALGEHHRLTERCLLEDVLEEELQAKARVVEAGDEFLLVAPFAARFPYEMLLAPRSHVPRFEDEPPERAAAFGAALGRALARLDLVLEASPFPGFHFAIHTAPARARAERYHWHCEVMPALGFHAGFEKGTGMFLNHVSPERGAERLRSALP